MEVGHFVDDDVFDAGDGFFGEHQAEPDPFFLDVACPPACCHFLDSAFVHAFPNDGLPFFDQVFSQGEELFSLPGFDEFLFGFFCCACFDVEPEAVAIEDGVLFGFCLVDF